MKSRKFFGMVVVLMALVSVTARGNENYDNPDSGDSNVNDIYDFNKVVEITWKLYGFGTVGEDEVQKVKPEKGDERWKNEQYTILFKEDGTLKGHTFSNDFFGEYSIDGNNLVIGDLWATEIGEEYDGDEYYEALYSPLTHFFEIKNGQLLLYYNEGQNYLLYNNVKNYTQDYFPEGTKWTEIRLDTLKYDSWYSKVGDEWVPNFETIEYYVKGEYVEKKWDDNINIKKVYTNSSEWTDSLTLLLWEGSFNGDDKCVLATVPPVTGFDGSSYLLFPGNAYQFDWSIGTIVEFEDITSSNATAIFPPGTFDFGTIDEIKEGDFGGASSLSYADVNGVRIIQGIGVTTWNDGECLFGPVEPYQARTFFQEESEEDRHYRSMLVHFERNGEVLYDVWPEKGTTSRMKSVSEAKTPAADTLYDLQGRRVMGIPRKGVYIQNGKKLIVK